MNACVNASDGGHSHERTTTSTNLNNNEVSPIHVSVCLLSYSSARVCLVSIYLFVAMIFRPCPLTFRVAVCGLPTLSDNDSTHDSSISTCACFLCSEPALTACSSSNSSANSSAASCSTTSSVGTGTFGDSVFKIQRFVQTPRRHGGYLAGQEPRDRKKHLYAEVDNILTTLQFGASGTNGGGAGRA